jgi:hypothetical protein
VDTLLNASKKLEKTEPDIVIPIEENHKDKNKDDEERSDNKITNTHEDLVLDLEDKFEKVSFKVPTTMEQTTPTPSWTAAAGGSFFSPPPSSQKIELPLLICSLPDIPYLDMFTGSVQIEPPPGDAAYQMLDFYWQNGMKEYPTITVANPDLPERNKIFYISHLNEK